MPGANPQQGGAVLLRGSYCPGETGSMPLFTSDPHFCSHNQPTQLHREPHDRYATCVSYKGQVMDLYKATLSAQTMQE
jgi:hypothetical protein